MMKLRLMICAMAAGTALFATDYPSSNVYGVLSVSDTATSNTVVGVPWMNIGEGTPAAVTLSNLVSTATLDAGDIVYLYENGTWLGYRLTSGGVWDPLTTINGATVASPGSADAKALTRGTGIIIQRANNQDPIYLCGRYDATTVSTSVPANSMVLIANPKPTDAYITAGSAGDQINIPKNGGAMDMYERRSDGWYGTEIIQVGGFDVKKKVKLDNGVLIGAGKGAFYKNNSDAAVTIQW